GLALGNVASLALQNLWPLKEFSTAHLIVNIAKQAFIARYPEARSHLLLKIATHPLTLCAAYIVRGITQNRWLEVGVAAASALTLALNTWNKRDAYVEALSENPLKAIVAGALLALNTGSEIVTASCAFAATTLSPTIIRNWALGEVK